MSFIGSLFGKQNKHEQAKKIGGIIAYLGLEDFWNSLTPQDQSDLIRYYQGGLSPNTNGSPIEGNIGNSSNNIFKYFSSMLTWTEREKNYSLSEKIIQCGHKVNYSNSSILDYHFFLQTSADIYYKQKDSRDNAIDKVIDFCKEDVSLFPQYSKVMEKEYGSIPRITTFQTLVMAYEKKQMYSEAIEVCRLALSYNLQDSTKGGYEGRLERLKKKV